MGEPVLSSWLDPVASSRGTTDKDLVQRHCEKADEVDARIRTLSKQLRVANAARNELELQIAQLHALGPEAAWRQRMLVAEAAAAAAATAAAAAAPHGLARYIAIHFIEDRYKEGVARGKKGNLGAIYYFSLLSPL